MFRLIEQTAAVILRTLSGAISKKKIAFSDLLVCSLRKSELIVLLEHLQRFHLLKVIEIKRQLVKLYHFLSSNPHLCHQAAVT